MKHDVGAFAALSGGALLEAETNGVKVLLSRSVDRVICPWHHAIFDLATGDHLEPPDKGCLARFEASVEDGRILLDVPEGAGPHRPEVGPAMRRRDGTDVCAMLEDPAPARERLAATGRDPKALIGAG